MYLWGPLLLTPAAWSLAEGDFQFSFFSGWLFLVVLLSIFWPHHYLFLGCPRPVVGSISHSSPLDGWYLYSTGRLMLDLRNHPHLEPIGMDVAFPGRACYCSHQENYLAWWFCPSLSYLLQPGWLFPPEILAQVANLISYSEPPGCLFERLVG